MTNSEIIARRIKIDDILLEIAALTCYKKKTFLELPSQQATKINREAEKLITMEETQQFFDEVDKILQIFMKDYDDNQLHNYSYQKINKGHFTSCRNSSYCETISRTNAVHNRGNESSF